MSAGGSGRPEPSRPLISFVAAFSGLYDIVAGAFLLSGASHFLALAGVAPVPRILSDLNALFLLAVGAGYYLPWQEPHLYRGYMWVMGVGLKAAGAGLFLVEYVFRGSPPGVLLFAGADGLVAALTLAALLRERSGPASGQDARRPSIR
jgi:hypothetical protein